MSIFIIKKQSVTGNPGQAEHEGLYLVRNIMVSKADDSILSK